MAKVRGSQAGEAIARALGLDPTRVASLSISYQVDGAAMVHVDMYLSDEDAKLVETRLRAFQPPPRNKQWDHLHEEGEEQAGL